MRRWIAGSILGLIISSVISFGLGHTSAGIILLLLSGYVLMFAAFLWSAARNEGVNIRKEDVGPEYFMPPFY
jgi:hypothetical protein